MRLFCGRPITIEAVLDQVQGGLCVITCKNGVRVLQVIAVTVIKRQHNRLVGQRVLQLRYVRKGPAVLGEIRHLALKLSRSHPQFIKLGAASMPGHHVVH